MTAVVDRGLAGSLTSIGVDGSFVGGQNVRAHFLADWGLADLSLGTTYYYV